MTKILKKFLILFSIIISPFLFLGCSVNNVLNEKTANFPIIKEIGNYIIEIEYSKLYKNSLITKYYITSKDGSNIERSSIFANVKDIDNVIDYGIYPIEVLWEKIDDNKMVVVKEYLIASKNFNSINIKYDLDGTKIKNISAEEKNISGSYHLIESNDNYKYIHNKFYLDGFNFTIESINHLDFGSIIQFYITDTQEDKVDTLSNKILSNYYLKLKSNEYIKTYEIEHSASLIDENLIKDLVLQNNRNNNYDIDIKYISFFQGNLIYDSNNINIDDMQVYLINKITGEETLIY